MCYFQCFQLYLLICSNITKFVPTKMQLFVDAKIPSKQKSKVGNTSFFQWINSFSFLWMYNFLELNRKKLVLVKKNYSFFFSHNLRLYVIILIIREMSINFNYTHASNVISEMTLVCLLSKQLWQITAETKQTNL